MHPFTPISGMRNEAASRFSVVRVQSAFYASRPPLLLGKGVSETCLTEENENCLFQCAESFGCHTK